MLISSGYYFRFLEFIKYWIRVDKDVFLGENGELLLVKGEVSFRELMISVYLRVVFLLVGI